MADTIDSFRKLEELDEVQSGQAPTNDCLASEASIPGREASIATTKTYKLIYKSAKLIYGVFSKAFKSKLQATTMRFSFGYPIFFDSKKAA